MTGRWSLVQVCAAGAPPCAWSVRARGAITPPVSVFSRTVYLPCTSPWPPAAVRLRRFVFASRRIIRSCRPGHSGGPSLSPRRGGWWPARWSQGAAGRRLAGKRAPISARFKTTCSHGYSSAACSGAGCGHRRVAGARSGVASGTPSSASSHSARYAGRYRVCIRH